MSEAPLGEAVPHFGSGRRKTARFIAPPSRRAERGQTILLVAVSMIALLAMAALAIDVTTLYIARSEAEKAADAGALAGAKAFVSTGFTSGGLGVPAASEALACNGGTGFADVQARVAASQNQIAGGPPTTVTTTCAFPSPQNPQITVTVNRTNLPTFFSRIWGAAGSQVTVSSKAEAYNPSGLAAPISVASVKPWLVPNCDHLSFRYPQTRIASVHPLAGAHTSWILPQTMPSQMAGSLLDGRSIWLRRSHWEQRSF